MIDRVYRNQTYVDTSVSDVADLAKKKADGGYRLVQICATSKDGDTDLLYSFCKCGELVNYKMPVPEDMVVPSISTSYWSAFIFENEIHDLFDVSFSDLKLDYHGNFFRLSKKTPWKTEKKEAE